MAEDASDPSVGSCPLPFLLRACPIRAGMGLGPRNPASLGGAYGEATMKGNQKRDMGKGVGLGNLVPTLFGNTGVAFVRNEPLFFVLMRIQVNLGSLASSTILFLGAILILCGLAGKLGCALGVMEGEVNKLAVAIGMITWGEVGLIFAGIAASLTMQGQPMLSEGMFSAIVLMVLVTTLIGPIGLRWAFRGSRASQG